MSSGSNITPSVMPAHPPQREKTVHDSDAQAVPGPNRVVEPTKMTGAQAIVRSLEELGVTDVFGLPGGAILPTYDPPWIPPYPPHPGASRTRCRPRSPGPLPGHRQNRCAIATSVPGNQPSNRDCRCQHGLRGRGVYYRSGRFQLIGSDAFQEADIVGITMPITKHSFWCVVPRRSPGPS